MRQLAVMALVLAACSTGPQWIGASPSWRGSSPAPKVVAPAAVTFAPAGQAAIRYNDPPGALPHSPIDDAVVTAVRDEAARAGTPMPTPDPRLFRACEQLAAIIPDSGTVNYGFVELALQRNGIIEPSPHLIVVWDDLNAPDHIVDQLKPRLAGLLHEGANRLGVGTFTRSADGAGIVVFALLGSAVTTAPIPRRVDAGGRFTVDATVDARYHDPEVFVTRDDGETRQLSLGSGRGGGFTADIPCGSHRGRQQIEIVASDVSGSTVLANFPVWCADEPPASITLDPTHEAVAATTEAAERGLFDRLNHDRASAGLPQLAWDDKLAEVARRYSDEMQRTGVVAHVSPISGTPAERVRAGGIKTGVVLENLARADGVDEAHTSLMHSPGHRANMMSSEATNIGIGVTFGEPSGGGRELYITQVFSRVPPPIDPAKAVEAVRQKLIAVQPNLNLVTDLQQIAQQLADQVGQGTPSDRAWQIMSGRLGDLGHSLHARYPHMGSITVATADLETLDGSQLLAGTSAVDIGIGVAQGKHPDIGDNAIWIVVMFGQGHAP